MWSFLYNTKKGVTKNLFIKVYNAFAPIYRRAENTLNGAERSDPLRCNNFEWRLNAQRRGIGRNRKPNSYLV